MHDLSKKEREKGNRWERKAGRWKRERERERERKRDCMNIKRGKRKEMER